MRGPTLFAVTTLLAAGVAWSAETTAPPAAPFAKVSSLVALPDFISGLGTLYVNPATLPAGPFLAYDHEGKLSATVYMVLMDDLVAGKAFDTLEVGAPEVSSVDIYYNARRLLITVETRGAFRPWVRAGRSGLPRR